MAECVEPCDIALWLGLGVGCAIAEWLIAECMESCMALGFGVWADAAAERPTSMTATTAVRMEFMENGLAKEWIKEVHLSCAVLAAAAVRELTRGARSSSRRAVYNVVRGSECGRFRRKCLYRSDYGDRCRANANNGYWRSFFGATRLISSGRHTSGKLWPRPLQSPTRDRDAAD